MSKSQFVSTSSLLLKMLAAITLLFLASSHSFAQIDNRQEMTEERMVEIIEQYADASEINLGVLEFTYSDVSLALIFDSSANRMRIVAPIIEANELSQEMIMATLVSNYHLALDARYGITEGTMYAVYVHPLKELTRAQIESAIRQVASLHNTFGTNYTSGELLFGVQAPQGEEI